MSQSPELAGGAGFTFENAVAASYLIALLQEGFAPGIKDRTVSRVALQQRDFGEALDDVIVDFRSCDGEPARLSLQVKTALTISAANTNTDFRDVIRDSWATLNKPNFRFGSDRFGVVVGEVASTKARDLRRICEIARASVEPEEFEIRFHEVGNASQALRTIKKDIVTLIEAASGTTCSSKVIHEFFAHFVLIEFDFPHEGSTSLPDSLNSLRSCLAVGHEAQAPSAWSTLCQLARESAGTAGIFDRPSLMRLLAPKIRLAAGPSFRNDLERVTRLTIQWLADIEDTIGGERLDRAQLLSALGPKLEKSRVLQIRGLPGSGKSVLLKRLIERDLQRGPVLFLKSGRLEGSGWTSFANASGLSDNPLTNLLVEIGASGTSTLYIDGVDRIEKQHQPIVRDLIHAIKNSPLLDNWRIVVSLRDSGIEPLRNWMGDLLTAGSTESVEVTSLDDTEARLLAVAKPHLQSLLFGPKAVREIVRRPFFAKILDHNFGASLGDAAFQPQSEVDLIGNWWTRGGYNSDGQVALERQYAIIELGSLRTRHLDRDIGIKELSPSSRGVVDQLITDGILQHVKHGHSVRFAHDIFFEWAFFHVLVDRGAEWLDEIRSCGEPPAVARVVELLSQSEIAEGPAWISTLKIVEASGMRSQWTRAWLLAPLASPAFKEFEQTFNDAVEAKEWHFLRKALVWFQAEKTTPNLNILARALPREERIRLADLLGWPSDYSAWRRFITFILPRIPRIPVRLLPDTVSVFGVWQNALSSTKNAVSDALLEQSSSWLSEIEGERSSREPSDPPSKWAALESSRKDFRSALTTLILRSAELRPDLVKTYLEQVIASRRLRRDRYAEIVAFSSVLSETHPDLLVELTLKHLKDELPEDQIKREHEEARRDAEHRNQLLAKNPDHLTPLEQRHLDSPPWIRGLGVSYHDWQHLAVNRDSQNFWPPSPLREPFRSLFLMAPNHALRLVADLSNHAITAWEQLHRLDHERPGTPIPVEIAFPWATQRFWGRQHEYLWHRGTWAPDAIGCGYMALEEWALSELQRGRPVNELIQQIVADNRCIAALGAAVSVALQSDAITDAAFPLVTSQRLLMSDLDRLVHDQTDASANLIGFRTKNDIPHAEAIKAANARPIRRKNLRSLLSMHFLAGAPEVRERTKATVLNFPENLPFEIEEHRNDPEIREALLREAHELAELVDIQNYRQAPIPNDDEKIAIVHVSPTATTPENLERARQAQHDLREMSLWMWASKYFETGEVGEEFTVSSAVAFAKESDAPLLFGEKGQHLGLRRGIVAAAAAVLLNRREGFPESDLLWARNVLDRAATAPEERAFPLAIIPWHHAIFVAHGFAADLRIGTAAPGTAERLLKLGSHSVEQVSLCAIGKAASLWDADTRLAWSALFEAFSFCRFTPKQWPNPDDDLHTANDRQSIVTAAIGCYQASSDLNDLPLPPPAWIKAENSGKRRGSRRFWADEEIFDEDVTNPKETWVEPSMRWHSQYAAKVVSALDFEKILTNEASTKFLDFISELLSWTIAKISPPWMKQGRDRTPTDLLEWTRALGRALGKLAGLMPFEQTKVRFLIPIFALEDEQCWALLSPLIDKFIRAYVYDAKTLSPDAIPLLQLCLERLLQDRAFDPKSYRAGELHGYDLPELARLLMFVSVEHAALAARYVNGDWSEIAKILPIVDRFVRAAGWSSTIMFDYLKLCERAKAVYPADQFADQVLAVIETQNDRLKNWHGTMIPARIAGLVQHFADRDTPLPLALGQKFLRILDLLIDMGDRRSAALQLSETFREIQLGSA